MQGHIVEREAGEVKALQKTLEATIAARVPNWARIRNQLAIRFAGRLPM
jgi:hypothetical protein